MCGGGNKTLFLMIQLFRLKAHKFPIKRWFSRKDDAFPDDLADTAEAEISRLNNLRKYDPEPTCICAREDIAAS